MIQKCQLVLCNVKIMHTDGTLSIIFLYLIIHIYRPTECHSHS